MRPLRLPSAPNLQRVLPHLLDYPSHTYDPIARHMSTTPTQFGLPNTLAPLGKRELRACFVFAGMGLFVLVLGLFPQLRQPPRLALPLAICWLALPAWGLIRFVTRRSRPRMNPDDGGTQGTSTQVRFFAAIMLSVGVGYFLWARHLNVPSSVILATLLIIEGVGGAVVSLTEWWRFSHVGIALGLIVGGFMLPFADASYGAVPVGGAFLVGSLASAATLHWQLRLHASEGS